MFVPIYEVGSTEQSAILFSEIDIDAEGTKSIVCNYQVNTVPTIVLMKDGKELERFLGYKDISKFEELIKKNK